MCRWRHHLIIKRPFCLGRLVKIPRRAISYRVYGNITINNCTLYIALAFWAAL